MRFWAENAALERRRRELASCVLRGLFLEVFRASREGPTHAIRLYEWGTRGVISHLCLHRPPSSSQFFFLAREQRFQFRNGNCFTNHYLGSVIELLQNVATTCASDILTGLPDRSVPLYMTPDGFFDITEIICCTEGEKGRNLATTIPITLSSPSLKSGPPELPGFIAPSTTRCLTFLAPAPSSVNPAI